MKTKTFLHLAMLIFLSIPGFSQGKQNKSSLPSPIDTSATQTGGSMWSQINLGYSNNGVIGNLALCYRTSNIFFGTGYYKSHICYDDRKKRNYFLNNGTTDNHKTVELFSVFSGIILPGKFSPSLSVGLSMIQFNYSSTIPIEHNVTISRIWETVIGSDYTAEKLSSQTIRTIGIPVGLNLHFNPKHFAGIDAMVNVNLNTHCVILAVGVGIHLGRIQSK